MSYITIFNCPKSVPNSCPNSLEAQQIQGFQAKGNTLPWQTNSILIIFTSFRCIDCTLLFYPFRFASTSRCSGSVPIDQTQRMHPFPGRKAASLLFLHIQVFAYIPYSLRWLSMILLMFFTPSRRISLFFLPFPESIWTKSQSLSTSRIFREPVFRFPIVMISISR